MNLMMHNEMTLPQNVVPNTNLDDEYDDDVEITWKGVLL